MLFPLMLQLDPISKAAKPYHVRKMRIIYKLVTVFFKTCLRAASLKVSTKCQAVQLHNKTASARNKVVLGLDSLIGFKVYCKERFLSHHYYFSFFFLVFKIHKHQISFARQTNTGKVNTASPVLRTQQNKTQEALPN